jgi:hypothetical protein
MADGITIEGKPKSSPLSPVQTANPTINGVHWHCALVLCIRIIVDSSVWGYGGRLTVVPYSTPSTMEHNCSCEQ